MSNEPSAFSDDWRRSLHSTSRSCADQALAQGPRAMVCTDRITNRHSTNHNLSNQVRSCGLNLIARVHFTTEVQDLLLHPPAETPLCSITDLHMYTCDCTIMDVLWIGSMWLYYVYTFWRTHEYTYSIMRHDVRKGHRMTMVYLGFSTPEPFNFQCPDN